MKSLPLVFCVASLASAQPYLISTIAGSGRVAFAGAGAPAINARMIDAFGVAADSAGNIFVSDQYYHQVFRVSTNGIISVYAGTGVPGLSGDNGPATAAQLNSPGLLAVDSAGNLYICDTVNLRVRKVSPDGKIVTYTTAGSAGVAVDASGNLYVTGGGTVHLVRPDGTTSLVAGTGKPGYTGDNGMATAAQLNGPQGLRLDAAGNLYVVDTGNNVVRKITPQGIITTIAGNGTDGLLGNGGLATAAQLSVPQDVAVDAGGNVYITGGNRVRVVDKNGFIQSVAGGGLSSDDGPANQAYLIFPIGIALDNKGNLLVALGDNKQVRRVNLQAGTITTVVGALPTTSFGENLPATSVPLINPWGIVTDSAGNIYVADWGDARIRKISAAGIVNNFAGTGIWGNTGDGGQALGAEIGSPLSLCLDSAGNLYATTGSFVVRRITPDGTITTVAGGGGGSLGSGVTGLSIGDGGKAIGATFEFPRGIVLDAAGNIYVADQYHHRIRRVDTSGIINTFAGTGVQGYSGDNGPAASAQLNFPNQLAIDTQGNIYVADQGNNCIRKITPAGVITTVAGTGVAGFSGDGGPATAAQMTGPVAVAVDAAGNLYIGLSARVRKVDASTGIISTIAGNGTPGFTGDGGPATSALLNGLMNLTVDTLGNVYLTDSLNVRVRMLTPQQLGAAGVLNAASLVSGPVAPGEIVTINVATVVDLTQTSVQVTFDGNAATVISTQPGQVTAIVPYEVYGEASTQLQIVAGALTTNTIPIAVAAAAPGIFTQDGSGQGAGMIANADGSPNSPANPAAHKSQVTISATGEGQTNPPGVDGQVTPATPPMPIQQVSVQIGGMDAPVISAGGTPNQPAGYFQVVAQIPDGAPSGDALPIVVTVGGIASQAGVTISVQ